MFAQRVAVAHRGFRESIVRVLSVADVLSVNSEAVLKQIRNAFPVVKERVEGRHEMEAKSAATNFSAAHKHDHGVAKGSPIAPFASILHVSCLKGSHQAEVKSPVRREL